MSTLALHRIWCLGVLVFLASFATVSAQAISTAQINGTVRDDDGLALPGVTVSVTQTETGLTRVGVTDSTGVYVLTNLAVGPYRLEAMLQGFRAFVQTGIVLQVNSNPTLNLTLQIGSVEETITVQGEAPLVETRNPGIGQVVTNEQLVELPLNGRQLTQLILTAGLATGGANNADTPAAGTLQTVGRNYPTITIAVAGGLSNGVAFLLDGGTHNDPFNNLNLPLPFPDAMQEFKVETSALPAQYGHHSAASINAVTKSGTNVRTGSVFEFLRDDGFNATNAFAPIGSDGRRRSDGLHRDQFGGTFGGPVVRDKLLLFAGYQGTRIDVTPTTAFAFVPTAAMLAGDFTAIASPACNSGRQLTLRAPFVSNRISPAQFSPAALNLSGRLPAPTNECGQVFIDRPQHSMENMVVARLDYQASSNHSIFGRYVLADLQVSPDADPNNVLASSLAAQDLTVQSFVLGDSHVLGANAVNAFRLTFNDSDIRRDSVTQFDAADLGIRNMYVPQPGFFRTAVGGGFTLGPGGAASSATPTRAYQVANDFSLIRRAHQVGIGASFIHSSMNGGGPGINAPGNFTFTGVTTGLGLADFLIGRPAAFMQGNPFVLRQTSNYLGLYVQDTWQVRSRIVVNAGLRWEPFFPVTDADRQFNHFSLDQFRNGVRSTVFRNAPVGVIFDGDPGYPGHAVGTRQLAEFAPRLSVAWDPRGDGRTAVRAAYGLFYDLPHLNYYLGFATGPPLGAVTTVTNTTFDDPWLNTPGGNPFPVVPGPDTVFPRNARYLTVPLDQKPPYAAQWNVSVQQQLGAAWAVSANLLGNNGHRLPMGDQLNPAVFIPGASTAANTNDRRLLALENPQLGRDYGSIIAVDPTGTSEFIGLLLSVQRRSSNGLSGSGNWTWSTCVSDVVNYTPAMNGIDLVKPGDPAYDRGSCGSTDIRHIVNLSTVYQLPHLADGVVGAIANDWQLSAIIRAQTGSHFSVTTGVDNALTGQADQRPNQVLDDPYLKQGYRWLDPAAFQAPAPGSYGNHERNSLVGPGRFNVDMGLVRAIRIGGQRQIQFRAEAFNVFNLVRLNLPTSAQNASTFGLITSADDPRIIQLALKVVF
jgi:hypothetical protein